MAVQMFVFQNLMVRLEGPQENIDKIFESVDAGDEVAELKQYALMFGVQCRVRP